MYDLTFWIGIAGSLILVSGAAWAEEKHTVPVKSTKNWLFAIGGVLMLAYAALNNYYHQAPFFYVIFELFIALTSVLMMLNTDDRLDSLIVSIAAVAFIIWSLFLFQGYTTVIFIVGLSITGLGFTLETGSRRRDIALTLGTVMIAIFSFMVASWIFFWLNTFFAIFSGYYLVKGIFKAAPIARKRIHRINS
jgi:hypothetical protein